MAKHKATIKLPHKMCAHVAGPYSCKPGCRYIGTILHTSKIVCVEDQMLRRHANSIREWADALDRRVAELDSSIFD